MNHAQKVLSLSEAKYTTMFLGDFDGYIEKLKTHYVTRFNLEQYLYNGNALEMKPKDGDLWIQSRKEIEKIISECLFDTKIKKVISDLFCQFTTKFLDKIESESPLYTDNINLTKIFSLSTTYIYNETPLHTSQRPYHDFYQAELCFISFGLKRNLFRKYAKAYPAIIASKFSFQEETQYDVLVFSPKKGDFRKSYIGRFLLKGNEIGRTPLDAAKNTVRSHTIY